MKQFKVYYNDGRHHTYYYAASHDEAIAKFCHDVGLSQDDTCDVWAEEVSASQIDTDFEYLAELYG